MTEPTVSDGPGAEPIRAVELWQGGDARWRWRYVEAGRDRPSGPGLTVLPSNRSFANRAEAAASAATAYPEATLVDLAEPPGRSRPALRRLWLGGMAAAGGLGAATAVGAAAGVIWLARRTRRIRRVVRGGTSVLSRRTTRPPRS